MRCLGDVVAWRVFRRVWWRAEVGVGGVRVSRWGLLVWVSRVAAMVAACWVVFGCVAAGTSGYRLVVGDSLTHGALGHRGFGSFMSGDRSLVGGAGESPLDGPGVWRNTAVGVVGRRGPAAVLVIEPCCNGFVSSSQRASWIDAVVRIGRDVDAGRVCVLTTPLPVPGSWYSTNGYRESVVWANDANREAARRLGARVVALDSRSWLVSDRLSDGLHWSPTGAAKVARIVESEC